MFHTSTWPSWHAFIDVHIPPLQIHLLDFDEEASELISTIYRHPAEIWQLAACPQREDLVATVHGGRFHADMGVTQAATLWKMPGGDGNAGAAAAAAVGVSGASGKSQLGMAARPLESLLTIEAVDAPIRSVLWEPVEGGPSGGSGSGTVSTSRLLLAVDDNAVRVWNVGEAWSTATVCGCVCMLCRSHSYSSHAAPTLPSYLCHACHIHRTPTPSRSPATKPKSSSPPQPHGIPTISTNCPRPVATDPFVDGTCARHRPPPRPARHSSSIRHMVSVHGTWITIRTDRTIL